ncbi:tetratricopeptide repeat protein [Jannaschia aquimarina]|nr:tetratricopeptide repeat protein [Jannaschia aquimarina]
MKPLLIFVCLAQPLWACPAPPEIAPAMDRLIEQAQTAPSAAAGRLASAGMWREWTRAPDARGQELLDEGMARRQAGDLRGALIAFDTLIEYCPDYAEGWNQRAFVRFLSGDFAAALPDLDRALELRPRHVAAMSGKGLTLIQLGRIAEGQDMIRAALELNPWLPERRYLSLQPEAVDL